MKLYHYIILLCATLPDVFGFPGAFRLHDHLFHGRKFYRSSALPVIRRDKPVIVYFNLTLVQIQNVDVKNQIVTLNMWVNTEWTDLSLSWDPDQYDGVNILYVPPSELWTPDIVLYNNAGGDWDAGSSSNTKTRVYPNGRIVWRPPIILQSQCDIDVEFFPFDIQECKLKMGTWTHHGLAIDLRHFAQKESDEIYGRSGFDNCLLDIDHAIDLSEYSTNVEWDLLSVTASRNIMKYKCCPEPYLDTTFVLRLRRKPLFYGINLICPCIAILILSVLVFYLPSESQERITLCVSVLLALMVFVLVVFDLSPPTSLVVPLISKFLFFTMFLITSSVVTTVVILNIHYTFPETTKPSKWLITLFRKVLPRLLFMGHGEVPVEMDPLAQLDETNDVSLESSSSEDESDADVVGDSAAVKLRADVKGALKGVRKIARILKDDDRLIAIQEDWQYIATVLDRMFLWIFVITAAVGSTVIFLKAPALTGIQEPALTSSTPAQSHVTRLCDVSAT